MICPKCHAEYLDHINSCGDCQVSLIDACNLDLPIPRMVWLALDPFDNEIFSDMAAAILDSEKIPYYIKNDSVSSALGVKGTGFPSQVIRIFVPKTEAPKAIKLLKIVRGKKTESI
tara:strand:- start:655 stop:1002 length:348 start_codon:yes stop_codon:yes gene_type:complete